MNRRALILGLSGLLVTPAIVRVSSLSKLSRRSNALLFSPLMRDNPFPDEVKWVRENGEIKITAMRFGGTSEWIPFRKTSLGYIGGVFRGTHFPNCELPSMSPFIQSNWTALTVNCKVNTENVGYLESPPARETHEISEEICVRERFSVRT
jgi:hypothetical protein